MRFAVLTLAAALAVGIAGCAPVGQPSPKPTASATPVFASDAEALAAAEKAYEGYLAVSDSVAADGGSDPERFRAVVTERWYDREASSAAELAKSGLHQQGLTAHSPLKPEQIGRARATVSAFTCIDLSAVRYLNSDGADVTPSNRQEIVPVEVTFRSNGTTLLVASNQPWSGPSFC